MIFARKVGKMGWNGSTKDEAKASGKKIASAKKNRGLYCFALLIVFIIGAVVFYSTLDNHSNPVKEDVVVRKPQIEAVDCEIKEQAAPVAMTEELPAGTYRDERGVLRYKGGARAPDPTRKAETVKLGVDAQGNPLFKRSIFKNRAEHEIARLLTMKPGQPMIGTRRYDARFEEEYKKSLSEPIIITKDDSPEDAELKQAMIETKLSIQDRMREGEKLSDILEEARSELQRLAKYKRDVEKMIREGASDESLSDQDVEDYITAANLMLQEKGIAPIKGNIILRRNILLRSKGTK